MLDSLPLIETNTAAPRDQVTLIQPEFGEGPSSASIYEIAEAGMRSAIS